MDIRAGGWSRRKVAGAVVGVCCLAGLVVVIGTAGDEPDEVVELADDPTTTTTDADETTSSSSSSSTSSTSTTSTTTTVVVEATTEPPPPPPPTTAPPPPPPPPTTTPPAATFGAIDVAAVRAFISSHHGGGTSGFVSTGEQPCPAQVPEGTDQGDNTVADVVEWDLMRTCDGRLRLRVPIADGLFDIHWMELDTGPGGCRGVDLVAFAYYEAPTTVSGVVATPGCASSSWGWRGEASWPLYHDSWLELHFALPAGVQAITWQAFVRGRGEGAGGTDAVPNAPHTFRFS